MQLISKDAMSEISGGSRATAILAGASCVLAVGGGFLGAALFGPTCIGMMIGTFVD